MIVERSHAPLPATPLVELRAVSRRFVKRAERHRSFQDLFIRLLRGRKPPQDLFWPLRNVSLAVHPGDSIGVIGPNGSGKSTLLKLITGILEPTGGELYVHGRISSLLELGAGFQPDLTGRENIYLNGSIYGLTRAEIDARLDDIIAYAELGDFIDTPVRHYSSGMHVRLGFAIAIYTEPDLLLVDEVLAVGDAAFQRKCLHSIQQYRDRGGTLFLVSHDLDAVQSICKRVIWLEDGEVQADGAPTDVVMAYLNHVAQTEQEKTRRAGIPSSAEIENRRWGTGKVRITAVELLDTDGQPSKVFYSGAPLSVRLRYVAAEPVANPVFGLAIHHDSGAHIAGPNTRFGGLEIPRLEPVGSLTYTIPALPLLEGQYVISVAAVDSVDSETYDYHDRRYPFQVFPGQANERYGLISLGGEWRLDPASESSQADPALEARRPEAVAQTRS